MHTHACVSLIPMQWLFHKLEKKTNSDSFPLPTGANVYIESA